MIKITRIKVDPVNVYDITVPETECFFANDILVHNCAEITLPNSPFESIDDEGEFKLYLDDGREIKLPGQHRVLLSDGTLKKVRELTQDDDINNLLI